MAASVACWSNDAMCRTRSIFIESTISCIELPRLRPDCRRSRSDDHARPKFESRREIRFPGFEVRSLPLETSPPCAFETRRPMILVMRSSYSLACFRDVSSSSLTRLSWPRALSSAADLARSADVSWAFTSSDGLSALPFGAWDSLCLSVLMCCKSSLILALLSLMTFCFTALTTFLARCPNRSELTVSLKFDAATDTVQSTAVRELPASEGCRSRVNLLFRNGMCRSALPPVVLALARAVPPPRCSASALTKMNREEKRREDRDRDRNRGRDRGRGSQCQHVKQWNVFHPTQRDSPHHNDTPLYQSSHTTKYNTTNAANNNNNNITRTARRASR